MFQPSASSPRAIDVLDGAGISSLPGAGSCASNDCSLVVGS
jgi:hypothetical protein